MSPCYTELRIFISPFWQRNISSLKLDSYSSLEVGNLFANWLEELAAEWLGKLFLWMVTFLTCVIRCFAFHISWYINHPRSTYFYGVYILKDFIDWTANKSNLGAFLSISKRVHIILWEKSAIKTNDVSTSPVK